MSARIRAIVAGPVPPAPGGIAQHTANMIDGLRMAGCTVRTITWKAQYPRRFYPGTLPDPSASFSHDADPILHWAQPWTWWRAGRLARAADMLVLPWVTPVQAPAVRTIITAASSTPTVALVHNATPHEHRRYDASLTRWALHNVAGVVVHADSVADEARKLLGVDHVEVVPHPPNVPLTPHHLPPTPPLRCLFFGIVRHYKGLDVALRALQQAGARGVDVRLTVAGEFWEPEDSYRKLVQELGISEQVDLQPGYVSDDRLEHLLATHHCVVAPYRSASQSGILPMALMANRPVITTRIEGLTQVVDDGVNGLVATPDDVDDLARCLVDMESSLLRLHAGAQTTDNPDWESVGVAILKAASLS